jgi:hypothetical protein
MMRWSLMSLVFVTVLAAAAAAPPAEGGSNEPANVAVTLIVGQKGGASGGSEKTYRMLGQDGAPARMLMGWRAPIPTRQSADDPEAAPSTSFIYQNVGVSADLRTDILDGGRVLVDGTIEISGPRGGQLGEMSSGKPPLIGTFQQALRVVLQQGKRLRVAEAPDPDGGTVYLDLQADLLE